MIIVKNISDLNNIISDQSSKTSNIGLVPTMGSLHEGHLALIRDANKKCDIVWVSIFVNPTQFNDLNDYNSYPNELENDIKKLSSASSLPIICWICRTFVAVASICLSIVSLDGSWIL